MAALFREVCGEFIRGAHGNTSASDSVDQNSTGSDCLKIDADRFRNANMEISAGRIKGTKETFAGRIMTVFFWRDEASFKHFKGTEALMKPVMAAAHQSSGNNE